jgi:hypothetical protein
MNCPCSLAGSPKDFTPSPTLPPRDYVGMRGSPVVPAKAESGSLKLLLSSTAWMPASAGMTNYDTASQGGEKSLSRCPGEGQMHGAKTRREMDGRESLLRLPQRDAGD